MVNETWSVGSCTNKMALLLSKEAGDVNFNLEHGVGRDSRRVSPGSKTQTFLLPPQTLEKQSPLLMSPLRIHLKPWSAGARGEGSAPSHFFDFIYLGQNKT